MKLHFLSMKRLAAIVAIGLVLPSCDKAKELININIPMQTIDVAIEIPAQKAGTQTLSEFEVKLNTDSLIKSYASSFGIANIRSVKIQSCYIKLSNASGDDSFGALSDASAEIKSSTNTTWGTFAQVSGNPDKYADSLNLNINSSLQLKEYFSAATISYKISGTARRSTSKALQGRAYVKYDLVVGP